MLFSLLIVKIMDTQGYISLTLQDAFAVEETPVAVNQTNYPPNVFSVKETTQQIIRDVVFIKTLNDSAK